MLETLHLKMNRVLQILLLLSLSTFSFAQKKQFSEELKFANYLISGKNYDDAAFLLENLLQEPFSSIQKDSISFLLAKTYYFKQDLEKSNERFELIKNLDVPYGNEASFFNAYNYMHLQNYSQANTRINSIHSNDSLILGLKNLELAGLSLLQRDLSVFVIKSKDFKQNYFQYSQQEKSLIEISRDIKGRKTKSPALAGILSALVPGTGKIYAGKTGQGIGTLITNVILGLQAWEGYRKDGVNSARFIAFGSIFTIFYVGNIWGSVFTVKLANEEFNDAVNHKILFDLHIPLRSIYN
jgi:TM2 domain-containing membrane protein YozV